MILQDSAIRGLIEYGDLTVEPVDLEEQLQPCSLDIRLDDMYIDYPGADNIIFDPKHTDMERHERWNQVSHEDGMLVEPDGFYLFDTMERIEMPNDIGAAVKGRSSFGRLGIEVHSTAGWVDAGFEGSIVLEISNNTTNPVRLYPGMRVAQLVFHQMLRPAINPYNNEDNKYQGQDGPVGSKIHEEYV